MKKLISIISFLMLSLMINSQVLKQYYPMNNALESIIERKDYSIEKTPIYQMPSFDLEKLQAEDIELEDCDVPFRFGNPFDVSYSIRDGLWQEYKDGRIWSISFCSNNAKSMNFILNDFYIPEGGYLCIVDKKQSCLYGPVTNEKANHSNTFLTDIIPGDCAIFLLFEPLTHKGESSLSVNRVIHGYRSIFTSEYYGQNGSSAPCNIDVACRPSYENESKGVGLVLLSSGYEICSGSLLMTTNMSFKPYFLTAFHCIDSNTDLELSSDEISSAENWLFMFNYKKAECNGSIITNSFSYNSATFRSAWYSTDFALLEIADSLQNNPGLTWLGWDRTGITPTSGTCVHHPCGDVMKINSISTPFNTSSWNGDNNHWYVNWDEGITQGGSSGAPFLNQNKLVVGQNHGKRFNQNDLPLCDRKRSDAGMFHLSWTGGGTNNTRLSNWLDPIGTGQTTIDSASPIINISSGSYIQGPTTYQVVNLPSDCTVIWSLSGYVAAFLNVQQNTPSLNQCTLTFRSGDHDNAGGQLIANIYRNNTLVRTLSKDICVINHLSVTYRQDACAYYGVSHPAIPPTTMNPDVFHYVHQGCTVTLTCSLFKYFNLSWGSGYQPSDYYFVNSNTFSFVLPLGSGGIPCFLNLKDDTGQICFQLKFFSASGNGNLTSNNISLQQLGSQLKVSLINVASNNVDIIDRSQSERNDNIKWILEFYNASTSERQFSKEISGSSCDVDISDWKKGLYIIRAVIADEILNEKTIIQ
ncbi:MAG: hypothetical protein K6F43_05140 [Prevotella sp.]|nr:hypothetical protein [Prevotella sp.]